MPDGTNIPSSLDMETLHEWSELSAPFYIKNLLKYIQSRKEDMISEERRVVLSMFLNPKKRGKWLDHIFGSQPSGCPNFAIDSETGLRTSDPDGVKRIYLHEGAQFLRNKLEKPSPLKDDDDYMEPEPPPDLKNRSSRLHTKPHMLPKWWNSMYNRNAKKIHSGIWKDLLVPVEWREVLTTIRQSEPEKAAGYDGVSSDLIRLLTDDSTDSPTPLLSLLTHLINVAFETGQTLPSWRKAIVTMVPKKKEDGSFTSLVSEMRPISVLQEFGKIASKILANRLGRILLAEPHILNSALLKDGCTAQCINIALNVLEDFKEKRKRMLGASYAIPSRL